MSDPRPDPKETPGDCYEIRLQGCLDAHWASWFEGMTVTANPTADRGGETLLCGRVPDQAALQGILRKIHDLGMVLVSVQRCPPQSA
jgi:hypothetical protein